MTAVCQDDGVPAPRPVTTVFLDANGTLLDLDDPVGRLLRGLTAAGYDFAPDVVVGAFRKEVGFFRAHHHEGRDGASLADLRRRAATVFAEALPDGPGPEEAESILLEGIKFVLFPDVLIALDLLAATGCRTAVLSNWDSSLPETFAELGVADMFAGIFASAVLGSEKPDEAIFHAACDALGVAPAEAFHVGDSYELDYLGATAAGLGAVLLDRTGESSGADCPKIPTLAAIPGLIQG